MSILQLKTGNFHCGWLVPKIGNILKLCTQTTNFLSIKLWHGFAVIYAKEIANLFTNKGSQAIYVRCAFSPKKLNEFSGASLDGRGETEIMDYFVKC